MVAPDLPLKKTWLPQLDNTEGDHMAPSTSSGGMAGSPAEGRLQEGFRKERMVVGFLPGLETTGGKSVQGFSRTENQHQEAQTNNLLCAEEMTRVTGWMPIILPTQPPATL